MDENGGIIFGTKKVIEFSFRLDNPLERAESFQMGFAYIGDNTIIRFGYFTKELDFSLVVGSHFNDGEVMFLFQPQQSRGHADVIVEIT